MKKVFYLIAAALMLSIPPALAQDTDYYKETDSLTTRKESKVELYQPKFNAPQQRTRYQLNAGSMFGGGFGGRGFATYVAPELSHWVNNRFRLSAGIMLMNSQFSYAGAEGRQRNGQMNQAIIYASGSYLVNDRLMVSGTAFQDMNSRNNFQVNPYFASPTRGMSVNAEYKVTKNFSVGAGFSTVQGNGYNGFYGPGMGQPFSPGMSRFGSGF